ncbi:hypothetical protein Tco_1419667 [Tanacetum coccineum]
MIRSRTASPPLLLPSTAHRDDIPEADMPLRKRARFSALASRFEVGESLAAAARQAGHALTSSVDYRFIDTVDASIRASESRAMTVIGVVNERITNLAITQRQEAHELQVCCKDAHDDRALLRAQCEAASARRAWAHAESRSQVMEAQIRALQRDVDVLQRQTIRDEDRLTSHIQHKHDMFKEQVRTAKVGPQDGPADAGSSC